MIKIYFSPSCSSCRKVKAWFDKEAIPYKEINILKEKLSADELKEMLLKSLDGTDEIISTRSKIFKEQNIDVESMSINELVNFILDNPSILKRPIIVNDHMIQVGYNSDEIEIFEREKSKIIKAKQIADEACKQCPERENCQHRFDDTILALKTENCDI